MSESRHTPGPWRVLNLTSENKGFIAIIAGDRDHICDVFPFGSRPGGYDRAIQVHEANARLIAAAPDLLAAIVNSDDAHWTPAMRAAIAKATQTSGGEG